MRTIKFRGRCIGSGTLVYGDLKHYFDDVFVNGWQVKPESVAQLVGYDCDGKEVYEGDVLILQNGIEYIAFLFDNVINGCKLKEVAA